MAKPKAAPSAFEVYAHEYDWMTNAVQRENYHRKEVAAIVDRVKPERVLDAGCATGLTTKLFAERGVEAVGLDRSERMLEVAREKFADSDLPLSFLRGEFERLPRKLDGSFDLVVCLANSITGVSTKTGLLNSLRSFRRVLRPGGSLVLQMLNYLAVQDGTLMPIRATENEGIVYARYSQRRGKKLAIHLVRIDLNQSPPTNEPFVHEFDNFTPDEVIRASDRAGFKDIRRFADLYCKDRFKKDSRNLVLLART